MTQHPVPPPPNPFCLALTGGIACGKSTVGAMLAARGLTRIDSDQVARDVVAPGTPGLAEVVFRFGRQLLLPEGGLDRKAIGRQVFADPAARRELEGILHPLIWSVLSAEMWVAAEQQRETVFEIPLLFENRNEGRFSTVWVVTAPREVQLRRLWERDQLEPAEAQARLDAQMSVQEKAARASFVLDNDGDVAALEARVQEGLELWRQGRGGERR